MSPSIRKTAVKILLNIEKNGAYINVEMNKLRQNTDYENKDIRLIGELVNGVIKRKLTLDYIINLHSTTKLNKIAPFILNVLRVGVYQLLFMDKIPANAAVDECVKIIKKSSVSRLSGYVNAVLRAVSPNDLDILLDDKYEALSIKYSYPLWLVRRWSDNFGLEFTEQLLISLNKKSPLYVRCNTLCTKIADFEKSLTAENIDYSNFKFDIVPEYNYSFCINNVKDITKIPGYQNGAFYVQDPVASLVAYLLDPQKGDKIIDLCAAPGGKSLFIASLMDNEGEILSCDVYEHKLKLISENSFKYKASCITPVLNDATVLNNDWINTADRVLCDVPCSGLGIIRKKPDIKYARNEEDIHELSNLSQNILENAAVYLKNGGTLVYSTCTIEKEENEDVINKFLKKHSEFSLYPIARDIEFYTAYPNLTDTDGFFICRLKKNG